MDDDRLKYNRPCRAACGRMRREGDIFCSRCYKQLPTNLRRGLWVRDWDLLRDNIKRALMWIESKEEKA